MGYACVQQSLHFKKNSTINGANIIKFRRFLISRRKFIVKINHIVNLNEGASNFRCPFKLERRFKRHQVNNDQNVMSSTTTL